MDITDTFQRSTTLLLLQSSIIMPTTEYTTEYTTAFTMEHTTGFTIPTLVSIILASVKLKLILHGCSITDILHTPAILDTLDSPDTPLPTTMSMSGTVLNTCGRNKMKNKNFTF